MGTSCFLHTVPPREYRGYPHSEFRWTSFQEFWRIEPPEKKTAIDILARQPPKTDGEKKSEYSITTTLRAPQYSHRFPLQSFLFFSFHVKTIYKTKNCNILDRQQVAVSPPPRIILTKLCTTLIPITATPKETVAAATYVLQLLLASLI